MEHPLWEHGLEVGLRILVDRPGGLLVEVSDGTAAFNASTYRISVFYDLAKVAVNRLAFSQGHELAPHEATAVAVTPGWLRSEMMLDIFGVTEQNWRRAQRGRRRWVPARPTGVRRIRVPSLRRARRRRGGR